jgi:hypothetical protein
MPRNRNTVPMSQPETIEAVAVEKCKPRTGSREAERNRRRVARRACETQAALAEVTELFHRRYGRPATDDTNN